jgi:hypothetical protein
MLFILSALRREYLTYLGVLYPRNSLVCVKALPRFQRIGEVGYATGDINEQCGTW